MRQRLEELRTEYEHGEKQLALLEQKQRALRDTLLRISGAIQVLEELLAAEQAAAGPFQPTGNGAAQLSASG